MQDEFTFHDCYAAMQSGKMIARRAWANGCFIFAQVPSIISKDIIPKMTSLPEAVKQELSERGLELSYHNQIALVNNKSHICGYTPTVSDLSADDWFIL